MALPEVEDRLFVGQGKVYYGDRDPATGNPIGGLSYLGNCPSFKFSLKTEKIKHKESTSGQRLVDKVVTIGQESEGMITLESFTKENLRMAMYAASTTVVAGTATDEVVIAQLGNYVPLANIGITAFTSLENEAGNTTYQEGRDYEIDLDGGLLYFPQGGGQTITDGQSLKATYTFPAQEQTGAFTDTVKERYFLFVGLNQAEDDNPVRVEVPRFRLDPLDTWEILGDQFNKLELKGEILPDKKQPPAKRYLRVTQLAAA